MKKLFIFIQALFVYFFFTFPAFAQIGVDPCVDSSGTSTTANPLAKMFCNLGGGSTAKTIQNIVIFFIIIAVLIALFYLLLGGIKWITSRGDKTEVEAARNHITAAIIGLIIVFLAVFLLSFILQAFGINWTQLVIPPITGNSTSSNPAVTGRNSCLLYICVPSNAGKTPAQQQLCIDDCESRYAAGT